ncbi:MAG: hypothetical protein ACLRRT_02710 [Ruthenibacterium lactatiformans]
MPTTDFFSGPGFEPEDVPVKKTSPAQQPVEKQPADDEPFAGMQKLDFDFLGGDDPAVPGETDPGDPFDDFSFQRPAAPAGPAQPARAPFVFDEEPARAVQRRAGNAHYPGGVRFLGGTDDAPVRPVSPAQAAPKAAPFVFDFDDAPVERPASRTAASGFFREAGLISAFRKKSPRRLLPPHRWTATRRCLWFLDDAEPIVLCRPRPGGCKACGAAAPAQPAPKAAPFVFDFDDALWASRIPDGGVCSSFRRGRVRFRNSGRKPARPAPASAAAPLDGYAAAAGYSGRCKACRRCAARGSGGGKACGAAALRGPVPRRRLCV